MIWVNLFSALIMLGQSTEFLTILPQQYTEELALALFVLNMALRGISNGSVTLTEAAARAKNVGVALLVAFLGFTTVACGAKNGSPERTIAVYGIQVVKGLDEVGMTAKELEARKVITTAQYRDFLLKLKVAYEGASKLASALEVYDREASDTAASQVSAALNALTAVVPSITAGLGGPGAEKLVTLVSEVNKLILNIALALKPVQPAPVPPPEAPALELLPALEGA
jgi:hypothetical protein